MSYRAGSGPSILCVPCAPGPLIWGPPRQSPGLLPLCPLYCGPAWSQLTRGFRTEMLPFGHDLPAFGLLLWTSIPFHPALWGGFHSPVPAFDKRIEKLLISPLRPQPIPIGLSAPPSLMPPNSASILPVQNRCLRLTKTEVMDAKKHQHMFLTGAEWVGDRTGSGCKGLGSRTHVAYFGPQSPHLELV